MLVLNIVSPVAGDVMAFLSVVVILGIKNPLVVLLTSSIALASGALPVEFIPTFWENNLVNTANDKKSVRALVFIRQLF